MTENEAPEYLPGKSAIVLIFTIISAIFGVVISSRYKNGIVGTLAFLAIEIVFLHLIHQLFLDQGHQ
jgi:hypothetical protein